MRASWSRPLSGRFVELVLATIERDGEHATLTRLLAKLDDAPVAVRRDYLYLLTLLPGEAALLHADRPYLDAIGAAAQSWRSWFGLEVLAST